MAARWPRALVCVLATACLGDAQYRRATNDHPGISPEHRIEPNSIQSHGSSILEEAFSALVVLQDEYFDVNYGTWPSAIDWTAAVTQTIMSGMLTTLSTAFASMDVKGLEGWKDKENLVSSYFAQVVASYFGQDILSIRGEAFDDILWVVLGWVEALKFVRVHSQLHYQQESSSAVHYDRQVFEPLNWHGQHWIPSFAHRARIFWNLGSKGWDTRLCHGGMVWSRRLRPYKNAITNELWISASMAMYQHFPGDNFTSPWATMDGFPGDDSNHLAAAIEGYKWLNSINMTNANGLFVDGYHISSSRPGNVDCDLRDEMVYTYNQGVVLTGLRGLWAVTGSISYLQDGHRLVQAVIRATGWDIHHGCPIDDLARLPQGRLPPWRGIGRGGILEEQCDASGSCSQDGQLFKGIFMHHLTTFCADLNPDEPAVADAEALDEGKRLHTKACLSYLGWIKHTARAALLTRDEAGRFGMWWGAEMFEVSASRNEDGIDHSADNTTDYRNTGTPRDATWGYEDVWLPGSSRRGPPRSYPVPGPVNEQSVLSDMDVSFIGTKSRNPSAAPDGRRVNDPNERGRGRSVETQAGGLALLRAYWEFSRLATDEVARRA